MPSARMIRGFFAASAFLSPSVACAATDDRTAPIVTAQKPFIAPKKPDTTDDDANADSSAIKSPDDKDENSSLDISGDFSLSVGNDVGGKPTGTGVQTSASVEVTKATASGMLGLNLGTNIVSVNVPNPLGAGSNDLYQYGTTNLTVIALSYTTPKGSLTVGVMNPQWGPPNISLDDYIENPILQPLNAFAWVSVAGMRISRKIQADNTTLTATVTAGDELGRATQGLTYMASIDVEKGSWVASFVDYHRARDADNAAEQLANFYLSYNYATGRQKIQITGNGGIDKNPIDDKAGVYRYAVASVTDTISLSKMFSIYGAIMGGRRSQTPSIVYIESGFSFRPSDDDDKSIKLSVTRGFPSSMRLSVAAHLPL